MNINFTDKELQVIQLIVPEMTPEETCNKVLRDWFTSNLERLPTQTKSTAQIVDEVLTVRAEKISAIDSASAL